MNAPRYVLFSAGQSFPLSIRVVPATPGGRERVQVDERLFGERSDTVVAIAAGIFEISQDLTIAIEAMQSLNPKRLVDQCQQHRISMCGRWPAFMAMESLRRLGWLDRCEQVAYGTSANVNGDHNRVVGYAGLLFGSRSADRSV